MSSTFNRTSPIRALTATRYSSLSKVIIAWGPLVLVSLVIFWFSSQPGFGKSQQLEQLLQTIFGEFAWYTRFHFQVVALDAISSEFAHFTEYAVLALASLWAVTRQWPRLSEPHLLAFVYPAYFALTDEAHQFFVPGRHCDWRDVAMDWIGAATALGIVIMFRRLKSQNDGRRFAE